VFYIVDARWLKVFVLRWEPELFQAIGEIISNHVNDGKVVITAEYIQILLHLGLVKKL
jgi:hypothetical protein